MMLLTDLCDLLSRASNWRGLQSTEYGIREARQGNPNYEIPEVREVHNSAPLAPALMLVTAPAAVGKSAAADFMSNRLKAPILDLSNLQVGDSTLEGALAKSLGVKKNAEFSENLLTSSAVLIVDALDEAEVRSGQANFRAFIRGVADTASQLTGDRAGIVIFSRAESSRPLQEIITERNVQYAHFEIRSFDRERAERYLDRRVADIFHDRGKESLHQKHSQPFGKARNSLFEVLASAITQEAGDFWGFPDVRDFLGYAPVLDVMAEYLAVDNFAHLSTAIEAPTSGGFDRWALVANVINQLMIREQEKFTKQFAQVEEFREHGNPQLKPILYAPEEQCGRLLEYVENMRLALDVPAQLPAELRESYEVAVSTQLSNHPFLRGDGWFNVVFRDYVTTLAQNSPITSESSTREIRKKLLSASWKHSPMYAFFSYTLGRPHTSNSSTCHSDDLGALYESFKSMCETGDRVYTSIGRSGNRLAAHFSIVRENAADIGPVAFVTHEATTSVSFPRELSYASVWDVPEVLLGGDHTSFKFGPSVYISCAEILFSAGEMQVYIKPEETPVLITVKSVISDDVKIHADASQFFVVCEDDMVFPWSKYQRRLNLGGIAADVRESSALYLELRRVVLRFKDAKGGEAAVYQPMMDNLVVGNNARARMVLDYLQDAGCVKVSKSMYLLDLQSFAKFGVSRSQLRDLEMTDSAIHLSHRILEFAKGRRE